MMVVWLLGWWWWWWWWWCVSVLKRSGFVVFVWLIIHCWFWFGFVSQSQDWLTLLAISLRCVASGVVNGPADPGSAWRIRCRSSTYKADTSTRHSNSKTSNTIYHRATQLLNIIFIYLYRYQNHINYLYTIIILKCNYICTLYYS